jgi:hypothetical protein
MTEAVFAVTPSETIKCAFPLPLALSPLTVSLPFFVFVFFGPDRDLLGVDHVRRTKLIDDAKRPQPRYHGLLHGTASIVREEGLRGIYRGLFPVVRSPSNLPPNHTN